MQKRPLGMIRLAAAVQVMAGSVLAAEAWIYSAAVAVDEDGTARPPELAERERSTFLRFHPAKQELTLLASASRRGEVTKLDLVHEVDGAWILSGVEPARRWRRGRQTAAPRWRDPATIGMSDPKRRHWHPRRSRLAERQGCHRPTAKGRSS